MITPAGLRLLAGRQPEPITPDPWESSRVAAIDRAAQAQGRLVLLCGAGCGIVFGDPDDIAKHLAGHQPQATGTP